MDVSALLHIVIYLLIVGGICALLWWLIGFAASKGVLKDPFTGFAQVLVAIVAVLLLINLLLGFMGSGVPFLRLR